MIAVVEGELDDGFLMAEMGGFDLEEGERKWDV